MRKWLLAVGVAQKIGQDDFVRWVVMKANQFPGGRIEIENFVHDLGDWVLACKNNEGRVTRRFSPDMSLRTVMQLSEQWHEAVAKAKGPEYQFPQPWYPGDKIKKFEIVRLTSSTELYQEGRAMHNCVGTYGRQVAEGHCYIYSIRRNGERAATFQIIKRENERVEIVQIRAACNKPVPREVVASARKWLAMMQALMCMNKAA